MRYLQASISGCAKPARTNALAVVWSLKDSGRAIRFYENCSFCRDGRELERVIGTPVTEVRLRRG